jgi:hypothetical protein
MVEYKPPKKSKLTPEEQNAKFLEQLYEDMANAISLQEANEIDGRAVCGNKSCENLIKASKSKTMTEAVLLQKGLKNKASVPMTPQKTAETKPEGWLDRLLCKIEDFTDVFRIEEKDEFWR